MICFQLIPLFTMELVGHLDGLPGLVISCVFSGSLRYIEEQTKTYTKCIFFTTIYIKLSWNIITYNKMSATNTRVMFHLLSKLLVPVHNLSYKRQRSPKGNQDGQSRETGNTYKTKKNKTKTQHNMVSTTTSKQTEKQDTSSPTRCAEILIRKEIFL